MAQDRGFGPRVGGRLALFGIHRVNRVYGALVVTSWTLRCFINCRIIIIIIIIINYQYLCWRKSPRSSSFISVTALRKTLVSWSLAATMMSDMMMLLVMPLRRPPPSPRRAGPRHSGRRINNRTTRLAFSSTLSPSHIQRIINK